MKEYAISGTDRFIGLAHEPFIIAEMSGNHNGSFERAMAIVDAAAKAGAHALKLQTYTADTMTIDVRNKGFYIDDEHSLWKGKSLYHLYREASTPWEWHQPIFERCRELGMIGFSTPYDLSAVDFLESLNIPLYKIASFENTDLRLIRRVAATGKALIISTGMAEISEIDETVREARRAGCKDLVLLKCTSSYPSTPLFSNLRTLPHMRDLFECEVGLSDHTLGVGVAIAAVSLGAAVIEKHFTLSRFDGGVDAAFSLEPSEMKSLVSETKTAWEALGKIEYGPLPSEISSMQFRRSLYIVKEMRTGEVLTEDHLRAIRPGFGLPPKYYDILLGRRVNRDIPVGTPVQWELLE